MLREMLRPASVEDLVDIVLAAQRDGRPLSIRGGNSKSGVRRPEPDAAALDMRGFSGVIDYDPAELVLTLGAGTPLGDVETLVREQGQMLAFDPFDHGPIFGEAPGRATIGGVVAAGVAGSQRLSAGGARDHLLGFKAVTGRGEAMVAGARVVKNVTGYDLPKLAAGSWGRLFAMTELTLKVLPAPQERQTWVIDGLAPGEAVRAMARALGSQAEVAAAAHLPASGSRAMPMTALRIQGFAPSVVARGEMLRAVLAEHGTARLLTRDEAEALWQDLRTLESLAGIGVPLWRVNVPPSHGATVVQELAPQGARWLFDWAGGLIWLAFEGDAALVRSAAALAGGHATLVRGPESLRRATATFHPPAPGVAGLEERIRRAFDPMGVFETDRFGGGE